MASLLQNTNPWMEQTFVYAASFDPQCCNVAHDNDDDNHHHRPFNNNDDTNNDNATTGNDNNGNADAGNNDDDDSDAHLFDSQYVAEPQTVNTIPSGLLPSSPTTATAANDEDAAAGAIGAAYYVGATTPPSRQCKIVQVIQRGGNFDYYDRLQEQNNNMRIQMQPHHRHRVLPI